MTDGRPARETPKRSEDGSRGWYEAAWGPMVSENAFFIKDVMTPNGAVSIVMEPGARSDDLDTHTRTDQIRVHRAALASDGSFANADEYISMQGEPHHGFRFEGCA